MAAHFAAGPLTVSSPHRVDTPTAIRSTVVYRTAAVTVDAASGAARITPVSRRVVFTTRRAVPRLGVMVVGLGGNNGTTLAAALLANKQRTVWRTRTGTQAADWLGSLTQSSTVRLGVAPDGRDVFAPLSSLLPMASPDDLVVGGWDISSASMEAATERAQVLEPTLIDALRRQLRAMGAPLPGVFYPDFIAANQAARADNVLPGHDKRAHLDAVRTHVREFKAAHGLDKVIGEREDGGVGGWVG